MKPNVILYLGTRAFPLERQEEILAAARLGADILMASPNSEVYADFHLKWNISVPLGDYETAKSMILSFVQFNKIDVSGVVAWTDREVELAAMLAEALGLPSTPKESTVNVRDKSRTRNAIQVVESSLNPRYAIISGKDELREAVNYVGTPLILKPCGNSGGRGIFRVNSPDMAEQVFDEYVRYNGSQKGDMYSYYTDKILVEQFVQGSEHSLAGLVSQGKVQFFGFSDKRIDSDISFQYQNCVPSTLPEDVQNKVKLGVERIIPHLGLDNCGFHVDFIHSDEGPKILEIGGRLGGESINSHLIPHASGNFFPYEALLETITGNTYHFNHLDFRRKAGIRAIYSKETGTLKRIDGFEQLRQDDRVIEAVQLRNVGQEVAPPRELYNSCRIISFVATCALDQDLEEVLDDIANHITVEVT